MTQEDLHLDSRIEGQPETLVVPFQSDEQPIKVENSSILSAAHEEAVQIFDGSPQQQKHQSEEEKKGEPLEDEVATASITQASPENPNADQANPEVILEANEDDEQQQTQDADDV